MYILFISYSIKFIKNEEKQSNFNRKQAPPQHCGVIAESDI